MMDLKSLISEFGTCLRNELGGELSFELSFGRDTLILENAMISLDKFNDPIFVADEIRVNFLREQGYYRPEGAVEFFFRKASLENAFLLVTFSFVETQTSKLARSSGQVFVATGELLASITKC